jgi:hypothetical protein
MSSTVPCDVPAPRLEAALEGPVDVIAAVVATVPARFALAIAAESASQPEGSLR